MFKNTQDISIRSKISIALSSVSFRVWNVQIPRLLQIFPGNRLPYGLIEARTFAGFFLIAADIPWDIRNWVVKE